MTRKILIDDLFIIATSGLPLYTACFGGENCIKDPDHILVSGFLSALFNFTLQIGKRSIREVIFDDAQLHILLKKIGTIEVLFIIAASRKQSRKKLQQSLKKIAAQFITTFKHCFEDTE